MNSAAFLLGPLGRLKTGYYSFSMNLHLEMGLCSTGRFLPRRAPFGEKEFMETVYGVPRKDSLESLGLQAMPSSARGLSSEIMPSPDLSIASARDLQPNIPCLYLRESRD